MLARCLAVALLLAVAAGCGPPGPSYEKALTTYKAEQARLVRLQAAFAELRAANGAPPVKASLEDIEELALADSPEDEVINPQVERVAAAKTAVNAAARREGLPPLP